jgi:hypothetical protein
MWLDSKTTTSSVYKVTLTNKDPSSCGASTFNVNPTLPQGSTQVPRWVSISSVAPGSSVTFKLTVSGTTNGLVLEKATNVNDPAFTTTTSATYP